MPNVVILNGTLCDSSLWSDFAGAFTAASGVRFLYPELLPADSISSCAKKIGDIIGDLAGETLLLGYSLGGIVALELAKQSRSLLKGLVLVCTNQRGNTAEKKAGMQRQLNLLTEKGLEAVFDEILLPAYWGSEDFLANTKALQIKQMALKIGPATFRAQLQLLQTRIDQEAFLKDIVVPAMLICGEDDLLCTAADNIAMSKLLPKARLEIIRGVGHMLPILHGKLLAEKVKNFIEENETWNISKNL